LKSRKIGAKERTKQHRAGYHVATRPLLRTSDYGEPISISADTIGVSGDRWVQPFFDANRQNLSRLDLDTDVRSDPRLRVTITPRSRIGAMPLLHPTTRRVAAGILVEPRFRWASLGSVMSAIGFSVSPEIGGAPLVPASAREIPPWIIAGPVIERIVGYLEHRKRGFIERKEIRGCPRGSIEWTTWASQHVPRGEWSRFPCRYSDPDDDPGMNAFLRWTLTRLATELSTVAATQPAKILLRQIRELTSIIGPGASRKPDREITGSSSSEWATAVSEAMGWVAEERGLGGASALDGLAWDISIDSVWEAWVSALSAELGHRLGLASTPFGGVRKRLNWSTTQSMHELVPDVELRGAERTIIIDAKYKAHLQMLSNSGWSGMQESVRNAHRADIHQALAYASLASGDRVDTLLVYPDLRDRDGPVSTVASLCTGSRQVRIILASLPFGFRSPSDREAYVDALVKMLR
jgi:hypothetical protein